MDRTLASRSRHVRRRPVSLDDLPLDLYSGIILHAVPHSIVRLCSVSRSWVRALEKGLMTVRHSTAAGRATSTGRTPPAGGATSCRCS
eukprot:1625395-Prymnesium_polylepis.1